MQFYEQSTEERSNIKADVHNTVRSVYVAVASEQAELMNQTPQHDGMLVPRGALGNQSLEED